MRTIEKHSLWYIQTQCELSNTSEGVYLYHIFSYLSFNRTRPKPAYGRQGLEWDRRVRIQLRRVHFGVDNFGSIFIF